MIGLMMFSETVKLIMCSGKVRMYWYQKESSRVLSAVGLVGPARRRQ